MPTFTNRATLTYNNETVNSNTVVGEIIEVLSITKTAVGDEYTPGGSVVYVISAVNSGNTPLNGLVLTDDLGAYNFGTRILYPLTYDEGSILYYINGVLQPSPAIVAGPPLTVSGINVPAGGNVTVIYSATANEFAPPNTADIITNTVTLSGAGVGEDVSAVETVTAENRARLTITKALEPDTVAQRGTVTYTFTIENTGNIAAEDTVIITDIFDPVLSNIQVTYNGEVWTENTDYTYSEQTGTFVSVAGAITVPPATYTQDITTGVWSVTPGITVITVTGTI